MLEVAAAEECAEHGDLRKTGKAGQHLSRLVSNQTGDNERSAPDGNSTVVSATRLRMPITEDPETCADPFASVRLNGDSKVGSETLVLILRLMRPGDSTTGVKVETNAVLDLPALVLDLQPCVPRPP